MSDTPENYQLMIPRTLDEALDFLIDIRASMPGDTGFAMLTDTPSGDYWVEHDPVIEVIAQPEDPYTGIKPPPLVAVCWKRCFDFGPGPEDLPPEPPAKPKSHLKLVT